MPRTGRRLIVVANRLPVNRVETGRGRGWEASPGGLVGALLPVIKSRGGAWVGWAGGSGKAPRPFVHEGISIRPVQVSAAELEAFYHGFSNRTLWPLYHDAIRPPEFRRSWWWPYVDINRRFAEGAAAIARRGDLVWVHDYHLQLVPRMLREMRPDLKIGFFLHTPFPPDELFAWLPWRRQVLEGLLGADVVGFQTDADAEDFARACRKFTAARGPEGALNFEGRRVRAGTFPISIDVELFEGLAADPLVTGRADDIRFRLGSTRKLILCVDRLDYTKGIDVRLKAYEDLLTTGTLSSGQCVLIQVAVPTRESVRAYAEMRREVEGIVGRINGNFAEPGRVAVHYFYRNLPKEDLVALYKAADVMLVTPLRDGMNLVAKEYVATRLDGTGVLVLSEFAGAATELAGAVIVNPYDTDGLSSGLQAAMNLPEAEARRRMRQLRRRVKGHDVHRWASEFLGAVA